MMKTMPDGRETGTPDARTVKVLDSIHDVQAKAWDACAGGDDPFVSHAFLAALEDSGSVAPETGWMPRHLAVMGDDGDTVIGCAPLYLKSHSYGEFVFDWGWADAYERAGGRYYPKLQAAVPFTPVTGRRLLLGPDAPAETADVLAGAMVRLAERLKVSSLHVTFPTETEWRRLGRLGFLARAGSQYHWQNPGYGSFDDFLAQLSSRKRKAIRKERAAVAKQGVVLRTLAGPDIEERQWDAFYEFYRDTSGRKWGNAYLNRDFFLRLGEALADRVVLVMAEDGRGRPVGGALNLMGRDTLFGRYWGCRERYRFLHFEACYYQAMDFAIARGLKRVEAGAQGEHKIQRGYLPTPTYRAHWIADSRFRDAVERFLAREQVAVDREIELLSGESPFRKSG
jgi:predicted N-acyltransferase